MINEAQQKTKKLKQDGEEKKGKTTTVTRKQSKQIVVKNNVR